MLKSVIDIFRVRREERWGVLAACMVFVALNALNVVRYWSAFSVDGMSFRKFIKGWHLSGFDPITYAVISDWQIGYNIYRHPLLPYFMWPLSMLNKGLKALTGMDCAILITAALLVFCATYAFLFLWRIKKDVVGLARGEAYTLTVLTFGMAYVMLATMVPDHFVMSMFCLTLTLWLCGEKLKRGSAMNMWQTIGMFLLTAGVSLNNGLKVFLAALVTRRWRFFRPLYLLLAVLLPAALVWGSARWSYKEFVWPKETASMERAKKKRAQQEDRLTRAAWLAEQTTWAGKDSTAILERQQQLRDSVKKKQEERRERRKRLSAAYKHSGKPMAQGEFLRWTDMTTSRWDAVVESLFGEGVMLHEDYLLGDVLVNRPVFVRYHNWGNYIVEAVLFTLFLLGIWCGRRRHFLWTAMSFFILDMVLHLGLGFGINELFIMSAHYLFVVPIAMAYLVASLSARWRKRLTYLVGIIAAYLWIWNVALTVEYLFY